MDVLFGDTFTIIQDKLVSADLYNLSLTCKHFHNSIPENKVKDRIVREIYSRIDTIFGDEFMQLMKAEKGVIIGSFITQVMLNETWNDDIYVCVPHSQHSTDIHRFMEEKGAEYFNDLEITAESYGVVGISYKIFNVIVCVCEIACDGDYHHGVTKYVDDEFGSYRNIYYAESNGLHLSTMQEIFARRMVMPRNFPDFVAACKRRFNFYRSNHDKRTMTPDNILHATHHITFVQKNELYYQYFDEFATIVNDIIFDTMNSEILKIVEKSPALVYNVMHIIACNDKCCHINALCAGLKHLHCKFQGRCLLAGNNHILLWRE